MKNVSNYKYAGYGNCESWCDLQIEGNVIICMESPTNPGTSITNMAEKLADMVTSEFELNSDKLIWIECYRRYQLDETWDLVQFNLSFDQNLNCRAIFGQPRWTRISYRVVRELLENARNRLKYH